MQEDITIDIFSKNDDDESDFEDDFGDDFPETAEKPASPRVEPDRDDCAQKYVELRKSVIQLFFCVCTLFETIQANAAQETGEEAPESPSVPRPSEGPPPRSPAPWWAWANLGLSGMVLLALFVSLIL